MTCIEPINSQADISWRVKVLPYGKLHVEGTFWKGTILS